MSEAMLNQNNFNIIPKEKADIMLKEMEEYRQNITDAMRVNPDYAIRICEAIVAHGAGYIDRMEWRHNQEIG